MTETQTTELALRVAEAVRRACVEAAREGFTDASLSGLCAEGAAEVAVDAVRRLDVAALAREAAAGGGGDLPELDDPLHFVQVVTEHVAEGLCVMDAHGRVTYMNPAAEETLGWKREELLGRVLHDAVHYLHPDGSPYPITECPLGTVLRGGPAIREMEDVWIRRSGEFFPVFCSCTPIRLGGRVQGAVLSLHDITARKQEEAERVRLLAAESEARSEAERANRTKADFLAVMSHELRTPLTAVMGYAELLLMGVPEPLTEGTRSHVERIDQAARHLLTLIEEILSFSRIEAGQEGVRPTQADVAEVAREAAAFVQPLARRKGLALRVRAPDRPLAALTDRGKLRQVLVNLLFNAIKFTAQGEVALEVEPDGGGAALLHVRDTGVGIAPEHLERIWEPFWQAQAANTREVGGTGLGLSISRRIVHLLGGDIAVASEPGSGSVFTVRLPLGAAD
ncbi:MAG TPA: ATP-binding protein [Longimicrobiaceae bacterium]|jgi:PAS domain S-box-containing protein